MKFIRTLVIISLLAAGLAFVPSQPRVSADCINASGNGNVDLLLGPYSMSAGTSITATMTTDPGAGTYVGIQIGSTTVASSTRFVTPHTWSYTFAADTGNVFVKLDWEANGLPSNTYSVTSTDCPSGPDMVPIPEQAVVGSFIQTTRIYFAPDPDALADEIMEVGKTAWVYGMDESQQFYRVMLSGQFFWVPVETMGPNYDDVWNGTPLPTEVVE